MRILQFGGKTFKTEKEFYAGSCNEDIKLNPSRQISEGDFGKGFYLTEDPYETEFLGSSNKHNIVSQFEVDIDNLLKLNTRKYCTPDETWLQFISDTQDGATISRDSVIGPKVTNQAKPHMENYLNGVISAEELLNKIEEMELPLQICLISEDALRTVKFIKTVEI